MAQQKQTDPLVHIESNKKQSVTWRPRGYNRIVDHNNKYHKDNTIFTIAVINYMDYLITNEETLLAKQVELEKEIKNLEAVRSRTEDEISDLEGLARHIGKTFEPLSNILGKFSDILDLYEPKTSWTRQKLQGTAKSASKSWNENVEKMRKMELKD